MMLIIMGVAGAGKSTVGRALAATLGWNFYDGDDFHPAANVTKMAEGQPLNDADRWPWLDALSDLVGRCLATEESAVLAASLLKERYRERVLAGHENILVVYLQADFDTLQRRLRQRSEHFMKAEMLHSQLADLEVPPPNRALWVNARQPPAAIIKQITDALDLGYGQAQSSLPSQ